MATLRLTLRTLLAYLDDTLSPQDTKEIGNKILESDTVPELIERIKKVTRRRRLGGPDQIDEGEIEENVVAEYLDNVLGSEEVSELESLCLKSDVHLAEIASCHQILTLVLTEPARVPPSARARMYAMMDPPANDPKRKPPPMPSLVINPTTPAANAPDDEPPPELLGLPLITDKQIPLSRRLLPLIACGVLLLLTAIAVYLAVPPVPSLTAEQYSPLPQTIPVLDVNKTTSVPAKTSLKTATSAPATSPTTAAPKTVPEQPVKPEVPEKPPVERKLLAPAPDKPNPAVNQPLGKLITPNVMLLGRLPRGPWLRLRPELDRLPSGADIVSLPGYRSEVELESGVRVTLWGNVPEFTPAAPLFESRAIFHVPAEGTDADLTLVVGRLLLRNVKPNESAKIVVRFLDQSVDILLADATSEVQVDLASRYAPGVPFNKAGVGESPVTVLEFGVTAGSAIVKAGFRPPVKLQAPPGVAQLFWDNKNVGFEPGGELTTAPPHWNKIMPGTPDAIARREALAFLSREYRQGDRPEVKFVEFAKLEGLRPETISLQSLCLLSLGALDILNEVIDALSDEKSGRIRSAAIDALIHFTNRQAENDLILHRTLRDKGISESIADIIVQLLHSPKPINQSTVQELDLTYKSLLGYLAHEALPVRELALYRLRRLDMQGAQNIVFDANGPADARARAINQWKIRAEDVKRFLSK